MIQGGSSVVAVVGGDHQILSVLVGVAVSWVLNGGGVAVSCSVTMVAVTQAVDGVAVAGLSLTLANMVTTDVGVTMVGLVSNGVAITVTDSMSNTVSVTITVNAAI